MELPYEILVHLFKFLPKSDRKAASETCRSWYIAANDQYFLRKKVAIFFKAILNDEASSPQYIFENSSIPYYNFYFREVEITNKINSFWDNLGNNMKSLSFKNCDICEKVFVYALKKCPELEALHIHTCKELFMSGRLLEGHTEGLVANSLIRLRTLNLEGNQYLTDALLNRFVKAAPLLVELNLSACSLQFHFGLVKRFYPPGSDVFLNPSESVLTFYFVWKFIASRAKTIKRLCFSRTLIDGAALKCLSETEDLQLEFLKVYSCDQLTNTGFLALTSHQISLRVLDIGSCTRVTDQVLIHICTNLVNLENLNIKRCRAITDLGIKELKNLTKLKNLNISLCEMITKAGLEQGICSEENYTLEELDVHSLNLDQSGLIMLSEKLPNLRSLNLSNCFNAVTDASIQVIFKNQLLLHTLKISHCDKVSDAGLTGMGKIESEGNDDGPIMSNFDVVDSFKIHLGSRAEEEIVRDARRKRDVMLMCEKFSLDSYSGYSLARLKNLKTLDISGCNKITDVSLTYAFTFKELKHLNLSRCQQITSVGIRCLVQNCPSIEHLHLMDCYNLCDQAVEVIAKYLKRLQYLELKGCTPLTDATLHAIRTHCEKLKSLDIQGCRNMSAELALAIALPSLHTVLVTKSGSYFSDVIKNRLPATKFLPNLLRKLHLH